MSVCAYMGRFRRYAACRAALLTAVREFRVASGDPAVCARTAFLVRLNNAAAHGSACPATGIRPIFRSEFLEPLFLIHLTCSLAISPAGQPNLALVGGKNIQRLGNQPCKTP